MQRDAAADWIRDELNYDTLAESEAPKRKKAKTTAAAKGKGKARGRQGKLAAFANMPLDVLSEVSSLNCSAYFPVLLRHILV